MSVFGFTPPNHPQQVAVTGGDPTKDERYTPLDLWTPWHQELGFTLDAAGCPEAPVSAKIGLWSGTAPRRSGWSG
jgi:hypothetical protein